MKKFIFLAIVACVGYFGYQKYEQSKDPRLEPLYDPPYVLVYGTETCRWTQKQLRELENVEVDVIFENIDKPDVKQEAIQRIQEAGLDARRFSIPVLDINGAINIGYQETDRVVSLYNIPVSE